LFQQFKNKLNEEINVYHSEGVAHAHTAVSSVAGMLGRDLASSLHRMVDSHRSRVGCDRQGAAASFVGERDSMSGAGDGGALGPVGCGGIGEVAAAQLGTANALLNGAQAALAAAMGRFHDDTSSSRSTLTSSSQSLTATTHGFDPPSVIHCLRIPDDEAQWPKDCVPPFALKYDYFEESKAATTVDGLLCEYKEVSSKLNRHYGEGCSLSVKGKEVRIARGHGWRSKSKRNKCVEDNRDISTAWWKYASIYEAFDGGETATALQSRITAHYPGSVPANCQLVWLATELRKTSAGHEERSKVASANRNKRKTQTGE